MAETQANRLPREDLAETQRVAVAPPDTGEAPAPASAAQTASATQTAAKGKKPLRGIGGWVFLALLGLLLLLGIALASGYGGYLSAIDLRLSNQATQVSAEAQRQFDLGMEDLLAKRYDLARQRFEYVIQLNPGFPGVTEALAQVLSAVNTTATPTTAPTPTLSPTPDLRGQEDLYLQARDAMAGGDWSAAIDTLLTLRKRYPDYMTVEVDGLLYISLRNRGIQKISQQADLEGGTYDLALAESFGPLDVEASNWRDWAVLYTRGASFWDVDWEQAVYYFSQLAQIAPNLMDASRLTAVERYRLALVGYADWLARQELWCEAQEQYQLALNFQQDPQVEPTASFAAEQCANPTSESGPEVGEVTLTPTVPGAEVTPTLESTPEPSPTTEIVEPTPTETQTTSP